MIQDTLYGPWDYSTRTEPFPYDDTPTYAKCAWWLQDMPLVEDWGCGTAWPRNLFATGQYRGIDGAWSQWCDEQVDLRDYTSEVPGAMMRHVLEHNWEWRDILRNFMASWSHRAAIVLFIPPQPDEMDVGGPDFPVPDIAVSGPEMSAIIGADASYYYEEIQYPPTESIQWGWEGIVLLERKQ